MVGVVGGACGDQVRNFNAENGLGEDGAVDRLLYVFV
jgi:hypothetical protein